MQIGLVPIFRGKPGWNIPVKTQDCPAQQIPFSDTSKPLSIQPILQSFKSLQGAQPDPSHTGNSTWETKQPSKSFPRVLFAIRHSCSFRRTRAPAGAAHPSPSASHLSQLFLRISQELTLIPQSLISCWKHKALSPHSALGQIFASMQSPGL